MKINYASLKDKLTKLLNLYGIKPNDAEITSKVLLEGDLRGYKNHGVERIFQILEGIEKNTIMPRNDFQIIKETSAIALIDGKYSLGQSVGDFAMNLAIKKAKMIGIGLVGVLNTSHLGVLSYYSELASSNSCVGIVMSTSSPAVVLKGGKIKTLGTNPISYSIPYYLFPITADFATSKVSRSTIIDCLKMKKKIPLDWAVDINGNQTDDPAAALQGGIQTIDGDIKGSLLSLLISIISGHMLGGLINPEVSGTRYMDDYPNKGDLFFAIHIPNFTDLDMFHKETFKLCNFITKQKISFRLPGERSHITKKKLLKEGIFISKELENLFKTNNLL